MRSTPVPRRSRRGARALLALALAALAFVPVAAADRGSQRAQFRAALAAAKRPPEGAWRKLAAGLDADRYPLYPYIELAALRPRLAKVERSEVERFLERWPDTLPARDLREAWLRELARRGDWKTFLADYAPSEDRDLQCDALQARLQNDETPDYARDVEPLWRGDRALPDACDALLRSLRARGVLADAAVWERLERAADAGSAEAADDAAALLAGSDRVAADRIVAALRDPAATLAKAKAWADDTRTRDAVSYALVRRARRDSDAAETAWADLGARFQWNDAQKNRILNAIALYRSTSYSPDALARLKALPAAADDDATREWRVRVALAAGDWAETLAALERMSDAQKADARWRYLRARMLGKLGRDAEAAALYAEVAREANFHGFLAADWSGRPYSICPLELAGDATSEAALAQQPDLVRAFEFRELDMLPEARREWNFALGKLDANQRRLAADYAYRSGWYDRAVFAFSADAETQRLYRQRFPLGLESLVKHEAAGAGIDPSWAYGILRAESAWMT
ncbi:MAG TPA: lytic murein transglycosylase, partial [Dokdonella sp.]|nr:lytic murein transglycosylase [Dokdonella sp.]